MTADESVFPESDTEDGGPRALYPLDYLYDMVEAIHLSRMDTVTLNWGPEMPIKLHFESEDWGVTGQYMLAPRIRDDD